MNLGREQEYECEFCGTSSHAHALSMTVGVPFFLLLLFCYRNVQFVYRLGLLWLGRSSLLIVSMKKRDGTLHDNLYPEDLSDSPFVRIG